MQGENFWGEFERQMQQLTDRYNALPSNITPSKKVKQFLDRNLSASTKREELEKILEQLESKISFMEKKAQTTKRKRARLDSSIEELLEKITHKKLHDYILIKLFNPDEEDVDHLLELCKALVNLPDAQKGDDHQAFGKNLKDCQFSDELKQLENQLKK